MSHELRTPLNSLLILAKLLADNPDGNLTPKQVEFAETIHGAGSDLLQLINDILDLSKVEAGKMDVTPDARRRCVQLVDYVEATFRPLTAEKGLDFSRDASSPGRARATLHTDEHRLQQVLRNLLSNAVKFTEPARCELRIRPAGGRRRFPSTAAGAAARTPVVAFSVTDTGIGIAERAAARRSSRRSSRPTAPPAASTAAPGLGLSISREIARLLGGEIHAESEPGPGQHVHALPARARPDFGLLLTPRTSIAANGAGGATAVSRTMPTAREAVEGELAMAEPMHVLTGPPVTPSLPGEPDLQDDRAMLRLGDRTLLVIADHVDLARQVITLGRERGFQVVASLRAQTGLAAAHELRPNLILLSLDVIGSDGMPLLDALKRSPQTRHIPVCVIDRSGDDASRRHALTAGALTVIGPAGLRRVAGRRCSTPDGRVRRPEHVRLLLLGKEEEHDKLVELIGDGEDLEVEGVADPDAAVAALEDKPFDCLVADLDPAVGGFELLDRLAGHAELNDPAGGGAQRGRADARRARLRGYARQAGPSRTAVPRSGCSTRPRCCCTGPSGSFRPSGAMIERLRGDERVFVGKKVLIVDDDIRNVFALTSVLEQHGIEVLYAENGREAHRDAERTRTSTSC